MPAGGTLAEVYGRLHRFGPEFGGDEEGDHGLTNHGPMVAEVIARRGLDIRIDRWLDRYVKRLAELPRPNKPVSADDWVSALGDARRLPDWTSFFARELQERPWSEVLVEWWPRLLPGVVAGSTHGVIRVGHAVRALRGSGDHLPPPEAVNELAHGLAFWAARFRELAGAATPQGGLAVGDALREMTRLEDQSGFIAHRLDRLERHPTWPSSLGALQPVAAPDDVPGRLEELIDVAVESYLTTAYASPVLLVHTATAPNAVLHVLPVLPTEYWVPSFAAAWAASAALVAAYAPPVPSWSLKTDGHRSAVTADVVLQRAAEHGDEHVIKFADTAVEAFERTENPELLAAPLRAGVLIARP